jgi:hypothetical protein
VNLLDKHSKEILLVCQLSEGRGAEGEIRIDFSFGKKVIYYIVLLSKMDNGKEKR